nr:Dyp-type peroxidase domain-containing protein [Arthrobacter sp. MYb213]
MGWRSSAASTPRNLFGFKDGTENIVTENSAALEQNVWATKEGTDQSWMVAGNFLNRPDRLYPKS